MTNNIRTLEKELKSLTGMTYEDILIHHVKEPKLILSSYSLLSSVCPDKLEYEIVCILVKIFALKSITLNLTGEIISRSRISSVGKNYWLSIIIFLQN